MNFAVFRHVVRQSRLRLVVVIAAVAAGGTLVPVN